MTLRCRKGDMAIVLQGSQVGKMVTIGEFQGDISGFSLQENETIIMKDVWEVHGLESYTGRRTGQPDHCLLPIRPGDLQENDETEKELTV